MNESDQIFSEILLPSEKVLWKGRPNPGEVAKRTMPALLFGLVWTCGILLIMAIGVLGILSSKNVIFGLFFLVFTLPFVLVGLLLLTAPFWASKKAKQTYYAITDKRAIAVENGKAPSVRAFNLADLSAPYIVGGRNCPDLYWTLQPVAISSAQPGIAASSSSLGFKAKSSQFTTTGVNSTQATRFEFSCLPDAEAAFEVAKNQNQLLEQQRDKVDPLRLDKLNTFSSQGKLYVLSGTDVYEFDGTRVLNRKSISKLAVFIVGPIVLCLATAFGLHIAATIINAKSGGIFGLVQAAPFTIFLIIILANWARGGNFKKSSAAMGAPPVDFSNSKVLARLQQVYAEQGCGTVPQTGLFAKLIGCVVATIVLGALGAMLIVPMWSSYQELQMALHPPQQVAERTVEDRINDLRDQVKRAEKKAAKSIASKEIQQRNLNRLADQRECLAAAQIEGSAPADAAEQYAKALPMRYQQLADSSSKEAYDKVLIDVGRDVVWYADCLRNVNKIKEVDSIATQLIGEIENTSKINHLDPLTEKQALIDQMTMTLTDAGWDKAQTDTATKLKQMQKASTKERQAGYNQLIETLLDSMH